MRTTAQRKKLHKKLWMWLAEHPEKEKGDWPGFITIKIPKSECFLCEERYERDKMDPCCECPLCEKAGCYYFSKWIGIIDHKKRSKLAKKIAEAWK